jgi:hypothetical protein
MRTPENLSDQAKRILKDAHERNVGVRELLDVYEGWRSDQHPVASAASAHGVPDGLAASVRQRLGLTHETSDQFEALGAAIDMLIARAEDDLKERWHRAKVQALESGDRDKKRIALRHLDSADYDDELVIAALIESLGRDDDEVALLFGVTAGMQVDPSRRDDVLRILRDELQVYERRRSPRSAFFASAIEQMYQNHPHATPPTWLIESLVTTVTGVDDPASYVATVDICALAVYRSQNVTLIEEWLKSENGKRRMFAVAVVQSVELSTFASNERRRMCMAFAQTLDDLALSNVRLSPVETQWLETTVRAELAKCD